MSKGDIQAIGQALCNVGSSAQGLKAVAFMLSNFSAEGEDWGPDQINDLGALLEVLSEAGEDAAAKGFKALERLENTTAAAVQ